MTSIIFISNILIPPFYINYDSTSCLVLLGYLEQTGNSLSLLLEEQNRLLYGTGCPKGTVGVEGASWLEMPSSPWTSLLTVLLGVA